MLKKQEFTGFPHKGWDLRDNCTEFILSVSLYSWCPATVNLFFVVAKSLNKPLDYYI